MTRHTAILSILGIWVIAASLLACFIVAQALAGKYGDDAVIPYTWLSTQILPILGFLLAAVFGSPPPSWKTKTVNGGRYVLSLSASLIQIGAIIMILVLEPVLQSTSFALFDNSVVFFSIWQGVVTACVGALIFDGR